MHRQFIRLVPRTDPVESRTIGFEPAGRVAKGPGHCDCQRPAGLACAQATYSAVAMPRPELVHNVDLNHKCIKPPLKVLPDRGAFGAHCCIVGQPCWLQEAAQQIAGKTVSQLHHLERRLALLVVHGFQLRHEYICRLFMGI